VYRCVHDYACIRFTLIALDMYLVSYAHAYMYEVTVYWHAYENLEDTDVSHSPRKRKDVSKDQEHATEVNFSFN
jgi:hypothetical protein